MRLIRRPLVLIMAVAVLSMLMGCTSTKFSELYDKHTPNVIPGLPRNPPAPGREIHFRHKPVIDEHPHTYERCVCGEHYTHEPIRYPPMNIHEMFAPWQGRDADFPYKEHHARVADFVCGFDNVHTATYNPSATNWRWYDTIILWSDTPLRDFSFIILGIWDEEDGMIVFTQETPLALDVLPPTDAVVLNVAFSHYLRPQAAIMFTDAYGVQTRMFIHQNMGDDGCPSFYFLGRVDPARIVEWHYISMAAYLAGGRAIYDD